jgi:hypothetical protein
MEHLVGEREKEIEFGMRRREEGGGGGGGGGVNGGR